MIAASSRVATRAARRRTDADVAVIGAGPAGIAAAIAASRAGRRVMLLDAGLTPGGQIWRHAPDSAPSADARPWLRELGDAPVTCLSGASVVDLHEAEQGPGFTMLVEQGKAARRVDTSVVVLATGARERFLPFPGWTLPGIVGVGAAQALMKMGSSLAGKRVVIAGTGPLLLPVAASLAGAGAHVRLVAEQAPSGAVARFATSLWRRPTLLYRAARYRAAFLGTRYVTSTWVTAAEGDGRVQRVTLTDGKRTRTIACDLVCVAYGLVPNTELARLAGCTTANGYVVVDERQQTSVSGIYCAGEPTGIGGSDLALVEGEIAGLAAAGLTSKAEALFARRDRLRADAAMMGRVFEPRAELRAVCTGETIVCRCEDVRHHALDRQSSARQAKLYTRAGMGACQGRICGAALEFLFGWTPDTVRAPIEPVLLSTFLADVTPASDVPTLDQGVM